MTSRAGVAATGLLALVVASCGSAPPRNASIANFAQPAPVTPAAVTPAPVTPAPPPLPAAPANASQPVAAEADPGLADLSPAQRRAYDLGYRDCRQGRYAPGNHLEAYRIGCGAAYDREVAPRPQG